MPRKHRRKHNKHRRKHNQSGGLSLPSGKKLLDTAKSVAKQAWKVSKDRKVVSGALKYAGFPNASKLAKTLGYGKRRRKHRRRRKQSGGLKVPKAKDMLRATATVGKALHKTAKQRKVLSASLDKAGFTTGAKLAKSLGYGYDQTVGQTGGSMFGNILSKITSIPAGVLIGATAGAQGAIKGLGKQRGGSFGLTPDWLGMRGDMNTEPMVLTGVGKPIPGYLGGATNRVGLGKGQEGGFAIGWRTNGMGPPPFEYRGAHRHLDRV